MTNKYSILKDDEKKIFSTFVNQFQLLIESLENTCKVFQDGGDSEKLFEATLKFDKQNISVANDIVDECVWLIQKNEPRANHLRFFVALINSCNNLKRNSAYLVNFTKFYFKQNANITEEFRNEIAKIFQLTIVYIKKLFDEFSHGVDKINENAYLEIFDEFLKVYKKSSASVISNIIKKEETLEPNFLSACVIAIKNFDRYLDNTIYIIENFVNF